MKTYYSCHSLTDTTKVDHTNKEGAVHNTNWSEKQRHGGIMQNPLNEVQFLAAHSDIVRILVRIDEFK